MVLANIFDLHWNRYCYQQQLKDCQKSDNFKALSEWQCFLFLDDVEPNLTLAIGQLPERIRMPICMFLLLQQSLLAIKNDRQLSESARLSQIIEFPKYLKDPLLFSKHAVEKRGDELVSTEMWNFDLILFEYNNLSIPIKEIIFKGIKQSSQGFFSEKKHLNLTSDYNLLCFHHGGIVWITIIRIICRLNLEHAALANEELLCNSFGLILAKVGIILSIAQDRDSEILWPRDIWGIYCDGDLMDLLNLEKRAELRFCVNHLILDVLRHVNDSFTFLSRLEDQRVFRLFSIPQIYALSILAGVYNNSKIEEWNKIKDNELSTIHRSLQGLTDYQIMLKERIIKPIKGKITNEDPTYGQMMNILSQLELLCSRERNRSLIILPWQLSLGTILEILILMLVIGILTSYCSFIN